MLGSDIAFERLIERALGEGSQGAFKAHASGSLSNKDLLFTPIDWYLGVAHRDDLTTSCGVASLPSDVSRGDSRVRSAYTRQVDAYLGLFIELLGGSANPDARVQAVTAWAALVGAVSMARAVTTSGCLAKYWQPSQPT